MTDKLIRGIIYLFAIFGAYCVGLIISFIIELNY
jgi:hypothetical protein